MKKVRVLLMMCACLVIACTDDFTVDVDSNKVESRKENKLSNSIENIYMDQIDHISMLMKLVWLDKDNNKYSLSLSEEEASKLGFTQDEYHTVKNYVKTINEIEVSHK